MLIQIKHDASTKHAQFVLVSFYRLSARLGQLPARLGQPVRQQRMLRRLRHREVDQPSEDRLRTLLTAQLSHHFEG